MRILADENCDIFLIRRLRESGHDVLRVTEAARGAPDKDVFRLAIDDHRVLLTHDLDFGVISDRSREHPPAIVLMRLDPLAAAARAEIVTAFLATIADNYAGKFYVVEPGNTRERLFAAKP